MTLRVPISFTLVGVSLAMGWMVGASGDAADLHDAAVAAHLDQRLAEASFLYGDVLALEAPRLPTEREIEIVHRFVPLALTTEREPFGLRDAVAILHPTTRTIAYHLFWEDDIDFPDDNEPCDHEVAWVTYTADGSHAESLRTYFHGRTLDGGRPASRPEIHIQWGKHGTLPANWRQLTIVPNVTEIVDGIPPSFTAIPLQRYLEGSFRKLSTAGRRLPRHPIAERLGWPATFEGSRIEFLTFSRKVDLLPFLVSRHAVLVSRFNSATLNRWVLPYNFRPKTEWPDAAQVR